MTSSIPTSKIDLIKSSIRHAGINDIITDNTALSSLISNFTGVKESIDPDEIEESNFAREFSQFAREFSQFAREFSQFAREDPASGNGGD
jgi:hypothetical protein